MPPRVVRRRLEAQHADAVQEGAGLLGDTGVCEIAAAGPYKFIGSGGIGVLKLYKFIWFGDIDAPKAYKFRGSGVVSINDTLTPAAGDT